VPNRIKFGLFIFLFIFILLLLFFFFFVSLDFLINIPISNLFAFKVSKLLAPIKRVYNRNVTSGKPNGMLFASLFQFFLNHSDTVVYDPEPVFSTFFLTLLNEECLHLSFHLLVIKQQVIFSQSQSLTLPTRRSESASIIERQLLEKPPFSPSLP